jgi:integrase/recombinase XerD
MTELRQKMIRAMDLKNLSPDTERTYLAAVTGLAKHYRQSPEIITDQMIEDYLLYLKNEKGNAQATCCIALTGLRFIYSNILDKQISVGFRPTKKPRKLARPSRVLPLRSSESGRASIEGNRSSF